MAGAVEWVRVAGLNAHQDGNRLEEIYRVSPVMFTEYLKAFVPQRCWFLQSGGSEGVEPPITG